MRISAADLALLQFHAVAATDSLPKSLFPYTHGRRGLATYLVDDPFFCIRSHRSFHYESWNNEMICSNGGKINEIYFHFLREDEFERSKKKWRSIWFIYKSVGQLDGSIAKLSWNESRFVRQVRCYARRPRSIGRVSSKLQGATRTRDDCNRQMDHRRSGISKLKSKSGTEEEEEERDKNGLRIIGDI